MGESASLGGNVKTAFDIMKFIVTVGPSTHLAISSDIFSRELMTARSISCTISPTSSTRLHFALPFGIAPRTTPQNMPETDDRLSCNAQLCARVHQFCVIFFSDQSMRVI